MVSKADLNETQSQSLGKEVRDSYLTSSEIEHNCKGGAKGGVAAGRNGFMILQPRAIPSERVIPTKDCK